MPMTGTMIILMIRKNNELFVDCLPDLKELLVEVLGKQFQIPKLYFGIAR